MSDEARRAETGVMQFPDDWPGVFIRGDNALLGYVPALQTAITWLEPLQRDNMFLTITISQLQALRKLLMSCDARTEPNAQLARLEPRP